MTIYERDYERNRNGRIRVGELLKVWAKATVVGKVVIKTSGNSHGDEIEWRGDTKAVIDSGFMKSTVLGFATRLINGEDVIAITVDGNSVPVCVLRGWKEEK